ncbi:MAG: hypothetical protein Q4G40_10840 [Brachybacterium sp.]|nr:hypothetical protein [Brachybacterium sp.]
MALSRRSLLAADPAATVTSLALDACGGSGPDDTPGSFDDGSGGGEQMVYASMTEPENPLVPAITIERRSERVNDVQCCWNGGLKFSQVTAA